jgi:hypothetical protein
MNEKRGGRLAPVVAGKPTFSVRSQVMDVVTSQKSSKKVRRVTRQDMCITEK